MKNCWGVIGDCWGEVVFYSKDLYINWYFKNLGIMDKF